MKRLWVVGMLVMGAAAATPAGRHAADGGGSTPSQRGPAVNRNPNMKNGAKP